MCRPVLAVVTRGLTVAGWVLWVFVLGPSLWAEAGCWRCAGCLVYMLIAGVLLGQRGLPCVAAQVAHRKVLTRSFVRKEGANLNERSQRSGDLLIRVHSWSFLGGFSSSRFASLEFCGLAI
jgi:hypothetical protein